MCKDSFFDSRAGEHCGNMVMEVVIGYGFQWPRNRHPFLDGAIIDQHCTAADAKFCLKAPQRVL